MKQLDRTRPFGTIFGVTANGARFIQDGVEFDTQGKEITNTPEPVINTPEPVINTPEPVINTPEPVINTPEPVTVESTAADADGDGKSDDPSGIDLDSVHHMVLKKMVKERGGEYIDRDQAIEFLRNAGV